AHDLVSTQLGLARLTGFGIAGMAKVIGDFLGIGLLANADGPGLGVDLGRVGEDLPAHFSVNNPLVLDVVIRKKPQKQGEKDEKRCYRRPDKRILQAVSEALGVRDCDFNRHVLTLGGIRHPSSQTLGGPERYLLVLRRFSCSPIISVCSTNWR